MHQELLSSIIVNTCEEVKTKLKVEGGTNL